MFKRFKKAAEAQPPLSADGADEKQFNHEALSWEAARVQLIEKSERRAWTVAGVAVVVIGMLAAAIGLMMPLKENTPYVVRVDKATGIPDIITAMDSKDLKFDEAMDKYWLSQFVRARETYDWYTLQKDYDTVGLLSSPVMGEEYAKLFEGDRALDKEYGNQYRVTVDIISVVPNGNGIGTVRFKKTMKRVDDAASQGVESYWVATIGYEYRNPTVMKESARLVNPFGFQVQSYRADPEMGAKQ